MCKMINLYLENMDENYDFLGKIGVDAIDVVEPVKFNGSRKPANRAERRKATVYAKIRRQELAKNVNGMYVYIDKKGKVFDLGTKDWKKHYSRKDRHQRFYEPAEVEVAGMVTLDEDDFGLDEGFVNGEFVGYTTDDAVGTIGDILTDDFWWNYMSINNAWMYKYNYMIDELMYMKKRLHMIQSKLDKRGDGFGEWMWGVM